MKQPELGRKILELRKSKGLTQENLVELCSINVRTIQRIESGEVTPRSYTIKAILDALDFDSSEFLNEEEAKLRPSLVDKTKVSSFLKNAFFIGIVYFLLAHAELAFDFMLLESGELSVPNYLYFIVKIAVMLTFSWFILGFYKLADILPNALVKGASILLIFGIVAFNSADMYALLNPTFLSIEILQISKSMVSGAIYLVFGIGLISWQKEMGPIALVTGCLGILSGIMFISVILALPGLVVFTIFEILLLILLFKASENLKISKSVSESNSVQFVI
ncbi:MULTISPECIES: helix-turn-helix domain-containing protein [Rhodonellum]|nr:MULTISPECIES: helix-turn-helix transcriptional regulator [Rhodonellum]SDY90004.1 Helix-turn-helix [Rhodonellum ikkaensis]